MSHHIHLTFKNIKADQLSLTQKRFATKILLPTNEGLAEQLLTTIVAPNIEQYDAAMAIFEPLLQYVIGWKLEGVVFNQICHEIDDFCYFELHSKFVSLEEARRNLKHIDDRISYSVKNKKYVTARRIYDRQNWPIDCRKFEVCYYEHWTENDVEKKWLECNDPLAVLAENEQIILSQTYY